MRNFPQWCDDPLLCTLAAFPANAWSGKEEGSLCLRKAEADFGCCYLTRGIHDIGTVCIYLMKFEQNSIGELRFMRSTKFLDFLHNK